MITDNNHVIYIRKRCQRFCALRTLKSPLPLKARAVHTGDAHLIKFLRFQLSEVPGPKLLNHPPQSIKKNASAQADNLAPEAFGNVPSNRITNVTRGRAFFKWQRESQAELDVASEGQSVHDAFMPEKSISERVDDCEKIQGDLQTDLEKHSRKLQELEEDVKDLVKLFKHLVASSPHGEQLLFMSLARIELQDEAVAKFDEKLREISKRKALS
jgi:hypothetical protein